MGEKAGKVGHLKMLKICLQILKIVEGGKPSSLEVISLSSGIDTGICLWGQNAKSGFVNISSMGLLIV